MSVVIVIPARFASSRLPEKMLLAETGWPLIRHTYTQAKKARLADRVVIATDDPRIAAVLKEFNADFVMTDPNHPTGTDRLAEVARAHLPNVDTIINVQGDEPELEPEKIDCLIRLFQASDAHMATLVAPFAQTRTQGAGSPADPNCVKAVLGKPLHSANNEILGYEALYFSRSPIPYPRDQQGLIRNPAEYFMHLGVYAYRPEFLQTYVKLPQGRLELTEKLEQLRILENGYRIVAGVVEKATPGIDTLDDYKDFVTRWRQQEAVV